jgi:hypothetical protein
LSIGIEGTREEPFVVSGVGGNAPAPWAAILIQHGPLMKPDEIYVAVANSGLKSISAGCGLLVVPEAVRLGLGTGNRPQDGHEGEEEEGNDCCGVEEAPAKTVHGCIVLGLNRAVGNQN